MKELFLLTLTVILSTACGSKQNKKQTRIVEDQSVPTQPEVVQKVEGKEFLFEYYSEVLSGRITLDENNPKHAYVSLNSLPSAVVVNVETLVKTSSFGFIETDGGYSCTTSSRASTFMSQTAGLFQSSEAVSEELLETLMESAKQSQFAYEKDLSSFELVLPEIEVTYENTDFGYTQISGLDMEYVKLMVKSMSESSTPQRLANAHVCDLHFGWNFKIRVKTSSKTSLLYFNF